MQDLGLITDTRVLAGLLHKAGKQIDYVVAVHTLKYGRHTL